MNHPDVPYAPPTATFVVGLVSMRGVPFALEENYRRLEGYIRQAAAAGAELVVTPEAVLDGYCCTRATSRRQMSAVAQQVPDGPYLTRAGILCRELGIHVVLGFLEQGGVGARLSRPLFNSCALIDDAGQLVGTYSKVFPQSEQWVWAGRSLRPITTRLGKLGMLICADRTVSPHFAPYAAAATDVVAVPMDGGGGPVNTRVMQQRAKEGGCWVLIANTWSRVAIDPTGAVRLAEYETEGVSVQEVVLPRQRRVPIAGAALVTSTLELFADRWDRAGTPRHRERRDRRTARRGHASRLRGTDAHLTTRRFGVGDGLLDLTGSSVTDRGVASLGRFAAMLQGLWLRGCNITDAASPALAALTGLRVLDLQGTHLTDAGIQGLAACTQLRLLDVSGTPLAGKALGALAALPRLSRLRLVGCALAEEEIYHLAELAAFPELRWLDVSAGLLTSAALGAVCAKRPELVVEFERL
jgi:predicted amidohydrolase